MPDESAPISPLIRPFLTPAPGICRSGFWRIKAMNSVGVGLGGESFLAIQGLSVTFLTPSRRFPVKSNHPARI